MRITLYQKDECHLCDLALEVLAAARVADFDSAWIDDNESLMARYGTRVPVLREELSGRELGWPFDVDAVRGFLAARAPDRSD